MTATEIAASLGRLGVAGRGLLDAELERLTGNMPGQAAGATG